MSKNVKLKFIVPEIEFICKYKLLDDGRIWVNCIIQDPYAIRDPYLTREEKCDFNIDYERWREPLENWEDEICRRQSLLEDYEELCKDEQRKIYDSCTFFIKGFSFYRDKDISLVKLNSEVENSLFNDMKKAIHIVMGTRSLISISSQNPYINTLYLENIKESNDMDERCIKWKYKIPELEFICKYEVSDSGGVDIICHLQDPYTLLISKDQISYWDKTCKKSMPKSLFLLNGEIECKILETFNEDLLKRIPKGSHLTKICYFPSYSYDAKGNAFIRKLDLEKMSQLDFKKLEKELIKESKGYIQGFMGARSIIDSQYLGSIRYGDSPKKYYINIVYLESEIDSIQKSLD